MSKIQEKAGEHHRVEQPVVNYRPLPDATTHIRLLKIGAPSQDRDRIVFDLRTFPLESCPPFVALSYVWGAPTPTKDIYARDGTAFPVTVNLYTALHELAGRGYGSIWADAVCINQQDIQERNKQVLLMEQIYQKAESVVVCLGNPCPHEEHYTCRDGLQTFVQKLSFAQQAIRRSFRLFNPYVYNSDFERFQLPPSSDQLWTEWQTMRAQPWFTRSWIVQEVSAARTVDVLYNGRVYSWEDITRANSALANEFAPASTGRGSRNIVNIDWEKSHFGQTDMVTTARLFKNLDATNPVDKLYAFRGLSSDKERSPAPDYAKSVEQVYLEYARYFLTHNPPLTILTEAGLWRSTLEIPTWVPDWSWNRGSQIWNYHLPAFRRGEHSLDSGRIADIECSPTSNPHVIEVLGAIIDTIEIVVDATVQRHGNEGMVKDLSTQVQYEQLLAMYNGSVEAMDLFLEGAKGSSHDNELPKTSSGRHDYSVDAIRRTLFSGGLMYNTSHTHFFAHSKVFDGSGVCGSNDTPCTDEQHWVRSQIDEEHILLRVNERKVCITVEGHTALVPNITLQRDVLAVIKGATAPFVFRRKSEDDHFQIVGDAYAERYMKSKLDELESAGHHTEWTKLRIC